MDKSKERIVDQLILQYNFVLEDLDCGDNACLFKKGSGMRTNGGCNCFENINHKTAKKLFKVFQLLKMLSKVEVENDL